MKPRRPARPTTKCVRMRNYALCGAPLSAHVDGVCPRGGDTFLRPKSSPTRRSMSFSDEQIEALSSVLGGLLRGRTWKPSELPARELGEVLRVVRGGAR